MADFDLSAVVRLDASEAVSEGQRFENTLDGVAQAEKRAGAASRDMEAGSRSAAAAQTELMRNMGGTASAADRKAAAEKKAAQSSSDLERATGKLTMTEKEFERQLARLRQELDPVGAAQRKAAADLDIARTAYERGKISIGEYAIALQRSQQAASGNIVNTRAQAAAYQQMSFQISDIVQGLAMGVNPFVVFGQQAGQVAQALQLISGSNGGGGANAVTESVGEMSETLEGATSAVEGAKNASTGLSTALAGQSAAAGANTTSTAANVAAKQGQVGATASATRATNSDTIATGANAAATEVATVETTKLGAAKATFASFLAGPWGAAVIGAITVIGLMSTKLIKLGGDTAVTAQNFENAAASADSFGAAQSMLGKAIDLTTGKLKTQNQVLIQTIRLQAQLNLMDANERIRKANGGDKVALTGGSVGIGQGGGQGFDPSRAAAAQGQIERQKKEVDRLLGTVRGAVNNDSLFGSNPEEYSRRIGKATNSVIADLNRLAVNGKVAGQNVADVTKKVLDVATAGNDRAAAQLALRVLDGGPIPESLKPYERDKKPPKPPKGNAAAIAEFGRDAADRIADIASSFSDAPNQIKRTEKALRDLDDIIDDLSRKKPAGFAELVKSAEAAKDVVRDSLVRPYNDFIKSQEEALQILGLQSQGRRDEADALGIILRLEQQIGPLSAERKDAILASVQAIRAEQREMDVLREKTQKYLDFLGEIEGAIRDATRAFARGDLGQFLKTPSKLIDAFAQLKADKIFEGLFGDLFRDLRDQQNGTKVVREASDRFATAINKANTSLASLGKAADKAAGKLSGEETDEEEVDEIVVEGDKSKDPSSLLARTLGGVFEKITGLFTSPETAKMIGGTIGKYAGAAIEGAATGQFVSGVANSLGIKLNGTGSQLGGAVGGMASKLTGIPGLDVAGSILGGLIGNAFSKPNFGTARITNTTGDPTTNGRGGGEVGASSLAGSVQQGLERIAEQLGGVLGNFNVSIGTFDGKYRVSTTGFQGSLDSKTARGQGLVDFGKDGEAQAIAYAIMDAIADGGITGLSAAVTAALKSSKDVDRAIREAVKTQELELKIGGIGASLKKLFTDFDKEAADRVRIARAYGLDLIAVEKLNAEERAKLLDDTLKSRIGGLQDLLDNIKYGDLFEGSAAERRTALLGEIGKAQADAEKGVEGAADRLADLYRQLYGTSRDAFGTFGSEFADDRNATLTGIERVIQMEKDRVNAAAGIQKATTDAILAGNALTNETNALLAQLNARINELTGYVASPNYGNLSDGTQTGRYVNLAA